MTDFLTRCRACSGLGYHRCDCWPGDCICEYGDETCEDCGGHGFIDPSYDDFDPNFENPLQKGSTNCQRGDAA